MTRMKQKKSIKINWNVDNNYTEKKSIEWLSRYTILMSCYGFCCFSFCSTKRKTLTACNEPITKLRHKILLNIMLVDSFWFWLFSFDRKRNFNSNVRSKPNRFLRKSFNSIEFFFCRVEMSMNRYKCCCCCWWWRNQMTFHIGCV